MSRPTRYVSVAAAAIVLAMVSLRTGNSRNGLVWADVVRQMSDVKTLVLSGTEERTGPPGKDAVEFSSKKYYLKDPGMLRMEEIDMSSTGSSNATPTQPYRHADIYIEEPGQLVNISLDPSVRSANIRTTVSHGPPVGHAPGAADLWNRLRKIASDQTREVGQRRINGTQTAGFEAPLQALYGPDFDFSGTVCVWASVQTALPVLVELQRQDMPGHVSRFTMTDIQANVPLSDDLFRVSNLKGWNVIRAREIQFYRTVLKDGVTLRIGLRGTTPTITERDVKRVDRGSTEYVGTETKPYRTCFLVMLSEAGSQKLEQLTEKHVGEKLVVDFNGEVRSEVSITGKVSTHLCVYITELGKTPEQFESDYLTGDKQASPIGEPSTKPR